jgi:hypothetical protein
MAMLFESIGGAWDLLFWNFRFHARLILRRLFAYQTSNRDGLGRKRLETSGFATVSPSRSN